jgi:hypothetical protein
MKTAFLLHRPVMDYEESINPRLIFTSRRAADKACREIREWAQRVFDTMPAMPEEECDGPPVSDDQRFSAHDAREAHIKAAGAAPYGWGFGCSDLSSYIDSFNQGCVEVMELPLNPEATR